MLQALLQSQGMGWTFLVPWILIFGIFWFLLIRPQQKQQQRHREMLANLKQGDKVITNGGLYGTIVEARDKTLMLRVADGVKLKVSRSAISGLQGDAEDKQESR